MRHPLRKFISAAFLSAAITGIPAHSQRVDGPLPKEIAGTWRVCRTVYVQKVVGNDPQWTIDPTGKLITFAADSVQFQNKPYAVLFYRKSVYESPEDFLVIQGVSTREAGVGPHQIAIEAAFDDRNQGGFVASEIYPIKADRLILNWNGWFLLAVRQGTKCTVK